MQTFESVPAAPEPRRSARGLVATVVVVAVILTAFALMAGLSSAGTPDPGAASPTTSDSGASVQLVQTPQEEERSDEHNCRKRQSGESPAAETSV